MGCYEIAENMKVIGSDGEPVGTVDCVEGRRIKLIATGHDGGSGPGFISVDMVEEVDGTVQLMVSAAEALSLLEGEAEGTAAARA